MTFIITLISLVIERFFHWSQLRQWRWFDKYQHWLSLRIARWPSIALLAISVLPIVVVVGIIDCALATWLYGALKFVFGVIVLLYCMGPNNLWVQVYACLNGAGKDGSKVAVENAQKAFGIGAPQNSQDFHQLFTGAIFVAAQERVFAVLFWFVILGPVGAVLYRSIALCAAKSELGLIQVATQAQRLLDWIPVRLFTFIFALGGHFTEVFGLWFKVVKTSPSSNDRILAECGIAALNVTVDKKLPENGAAEKAALELLDRVFIMGLVFLAIIVLIIR